MPESCRVACIGHTANINADWKHCLPFNIDAQEKSSRRSLSLVRGWEPNNSINEIGARLSSSSLLEVLLFPVPVAV